MLSLQFQMFSGFRACALGLAPMPPTRAGGRDSVLYSPTQGCGGSDMVSFSVLAMQFVWAQALERLQLEGIVSQRCSHSFSSGRKSLWEWLCDPSALHICIWGASQDAGALRLSWRRVLVYAPHCQSTLICFKWIQEG